MVLAKSDGIWQIGAMQTLASQAPVENFGSGHPSEPVIDHILRQPGIQRVPNPKVAMFIGKKFLEPELCQLLMLQIDSKRRPSTIADANGDYAFRTSETCDLSPHDLLIAEHLLADRLSRPFLR